MVFRILSYFLLILSVLFMPFWVSVLLAFVCMVYFNIFFEAVLIFFLSDLLYGTREPGFFNIVFVSSVISLVALFIIELTKKKLKFYN